MTDKGYRFSRDLFSPNIPIWSKLLRSYRNKPGVRYLEVGVFEGRSFFWMLENILTHPSARAVAIDPHRPITPPFWKQNRKNCRARNKIRLIRKYSSEALVQLPRESFSVIYVDGSHTMKNVIRDALYCWPLLKEGGLLIFDDYGINHGPAEVRPREAIDFFLTAFRSEIEILHRGFQLVVRKRVNILAGWEMWGCRFGPYLVRWETRQLFGPDGMVDLSEGEFAILHRIFQSLRIGQTEIDMDLALWEEPATQVFLRRLGVRKNDFSYLELRELKESFPSWVMSKNNFQQLIEGEKRAGLASTFST